MTLLSKLFIRWTPPGSQTEKTIDIDCSINEGYEVAADVAEHAVETGSNITDHVRVKNQTFSVEAYISNTPIVTPSFGMGSATGDVATTELNIGARSVTVGGRTLTANTFQFSQPFNRVNACDQELQKLVRTGQRVTVFTGTRVMPNCVITRYKWDRNVETGNDLALTLEFSQLRLASTKQVEAPKLPIMHPAVHRGAQPAVPIDNRSGAARLEDAAVAAVANFAGASFSR